MARSRYNFICITDTGKVYKYASQSLRAIVECKEDWNDPFVSIIRQDLHSSVFDDEDYEKLPWED